MKKKLLSTILAAAMLFTSADLSAVTVYADETQEQSSGYEDVQQAKATGDADEAEVEGTKEAVGVNADTPEEVDENCQMGTSDSGIELYSSVPTSYDEVTHADRFASYTKVKGIDVSRHQGTIDWNKVKAAGVDFAIIRAAYRTYQDSGNLFVDQMAKQNIQGAKNAGIKVGVYIYSQAVSVPEGIEEADYIIDQLGGEALDLPVVLDYEFYTDGRLEKADLSKEDGTSIANAFCAEVAKNGYIPMVYANKYMFENYLYPDKISNNYPIWLANYTNKTEYKGDYAFWQFSESGNVDGISTSVDLDFWYDDGTAMNSSFTGFRQMTDGTWKYYLNGKFNQYYTGLAKHTDGWWYYVKNGLIDWKYTGLAQNTSGEWYYVKNGAYTQEYTGLVYNAGNWFYVEKGVLKWDYSGYVHHTDGKWYYVKDGVVDFDASGLYKHTNGWWYYADKGTIDWKYTGLAKTADGSWYYVKNGSFAPSFTGLVKNYNNWFYVEKGCLNWDYTGFVKHTDNRWYYVNESVIDFGVTGLRRHIDGNWYYAKSGIINFSFKGLAKGDDGAWRNVKNGCAINDFNGLVKNGTQWFYVKN